MNPQSTPWRWETKISEELWIQELEKKGAIASPLFNGVPDRIQHARECYDYIRRNPPHSAEVHIAIAGKEHSYGTNENSVLHRMDTRSFTNARSIQTPGVKGQIVRDPVRKSDYVKYDTALDSIKDSIGRIDKPGYAYDGLWTIADIASKWAPAEDSNDPEGYSWFIYNTVLGIRSRIGTTVPGGDSPTVLWHPADERHYTKGRTVPFPDLLAQHHTDGWDSLHWLSRSPNSQVSATYLTNPDGSLRAQLVRHADTPHTNAGMNHRTLTVEWERYWTLPAQRQHADGVPDDIYRRLGETWAHIVTIERGRGNPYFAKGVGRDQLVGHNQIGNTSCPANLDIGRVYDQLAQALDAALHPSIPIGARLFEETGKYIYGGFRSTWEELERLDRHMVYRVLGYPLTNEGWAVLSDGRRERVQFFNKAVLIWNQSLKPPYDVTAMNRDDWDDIESFEEDAA